MKMKKIYIIAISLGLLIGLSIAFLYFNFLQNSAQKVVEVSFLSPRQAVIFWKSDTNSLGYVRFGTFKYVRNSTEYQTSSEPGNVHAVLLEEIPLEGLYISVHNESDDFFHWPKIMKIQYQEESENE